MKRLSRVLLLVFIAAAVFIGCRGTPQARSDSPGPAEFNPDERTEALVEGGNRFAIDFYKEIRGEPGNLFFSPYSISNAFAMTHAGAQGDTASEMAETFHYPNGTESTNRAFGTLADHLNSMEKSGKITLRTANALWADEEHPFRGAYLEAVRKHYRASVATADFRTRAEQVRKEVNQWVEKKTENRIRDLLPPGSVTAYTRLVLANAIYFKGIWTHRFDPERTRPAPFYTAGGGTVEVPTMNREGRYHYASGETVELLRIDYGKGGLSMVIVLPRKKGGLAEVEEGLSWAKIDGWMDRLRPVKLNVFLPRFEMKTRFDLVKRLSAMGVRDAFSAQHADFSGMTGRRDLYITTAVHKAFVEVNEEGTEAAAATGISVGVTSVAPPKAFRADHPFLFFIRDNGSGAVLFMGRLTEPEA
jgi:serpin B